MVVAKAREVDVVKNMYFDTERKELDARGKRRFEQPFGNNHITEAIHELA